MNDYQQKLKNLADLLASDEKAASFDISDIKNRMIELNLKFSNDPIDQLNQVLLALHELKNSKKTQTNQEKHH